MAETTKTDLICDTLGVVPLRRQTSNMLWHANVSWTFSRNVWGNQHFFFFFAILYTHNKHSQDSRPDLLHSNKSYTIERPGGRVGIWGYPYITSTHSLHSLQQAQLWGCFLFVSWGVWVDTSALLFIKAFITSPLLRHPRQRGSRRCPLTHKHLWGVQWRGVGVGGGVVDLMWTT